MEIKIKYMSNNPIIGTLSEKSTHAFLKKYIEPNEKYHERPLMGYVCDVFDGFQIFEIQTTQFSRLREKLKLFLQKYDVTIVYPVYASKSISWVERKTGEVVENKKSSIRKHKYDIFEEIYCIRDLLNNPRLHIKIILLSGIEYKYLDGKGKYNKIKASKLDKIPSKVIEVVNYQNKTDFYEYLPFKKDEKFTLEDLKTKTGINKNTCNMMLKIFRENLNIVERVGKIGNAFLYQINPTEEIIYFSEEDDAVIY